MFKWILADKLFSGFSIMRWTEYVRPMEFYEIEKHALKAAAAFVIGNEFEEKTGIKLNWNKMVDDMIFAYLNKVATSDINSNLHARIKKDDPGTLNKFILQNYFYDIHENEAKSYLFEPNTIDYKNYLDYLEPKNFTVEDAILYFSHKFATYREFKIIDPLNGRSSEIIRVQNDLNNLLYTVIQKIDRDALSEENREKLGEIFIRFRTEESTSYVLYRYFEQIRWSQTERIPKTTVAGHAMFVALLTYFMTKELLGIPFEQHKEVECELEKETVVNNFFGALFHDLSEAFTRDVISPIKHNVEGLSKLLNKIESGFIRDKILAKVEQKYKTSADRLKLLLGYGYDNQGKYVADRINKDEITINEFIDRKPIAGSDKYVAFGTLIKVADRISAFMEAKKSIDLGINTPDLQHGLKETQISLCGYIYVNPNNKSQKLYINDFLATIPHYAIDDQEIIGGKKV